MASDKNKITRVDKGFREELDEIREIRKTGGSKSISDRKATELIAKWKHWPQLKQDLINWLEEMP